jgi:hypothetical protein
MVGQRVTVQTKARSFKQLSRWENTVTIHLMIPVCSEQCVVSDFVVVQTLNSDDTPYNTPDYNGINISKDHCS